MRLILGAMVLVLLAGISPGTAAADEEWQMVEDVYGPVYGMVFSEGQLWVVQRNSWGLWAYDGETWQHFTGTDGMCWTSWVFYVSASPDGIIWIPRPGTGVMRFDNKGTDIRDDDEWACYDVENTGMRDNRIFTAFDNGEGTTWFGFWVESGGYTEAVVGRLTGDSTWADYRNTDDPRLQFAGDSVPVVMVDSQGRLWIGYQFDGVDIWDHKGTYENLDDDEWIHFTEDTGLAGNDVRALIEDESGDIWVGTIQGLSRYDGDSWQTIGDVPGPQVWDLDYDASGRIWAATNEGVAVISSSGNVERIYGEPDGLENPVIEHIEIDRDSGRVWCAQGRRAQVEPQELYFLDIETPQNGNGSGSPYASPNPWSPSEGVLSISGTDDESEITVMDYEGNEIAVLPEGADSWDGRNSEGSYVATGVYILKVTGGNCNTSFIKIAVVRK